MTLYVYENPNPAAPVLVQWLEDSYRPASGKYIVNPAGEEPVYLKSHLPPSGWDAKLSNGKNGGWSSRLPGPPGPVEKRN